MNVNPVLATLVSDYGTIELDHLMLDQILEIVIRRRLQKYQGNKTKAALSLSISRGTFRIWCKKYGIGSEEYPLRQYPGMV